MAEISSGLSVIIVGLLVVGILIVLTWALFNMAQVTSMEVSVANNPYCIREACTTSGNQEPAYRLLPVDDPQRLAYQHLSYCMVNSPPCALVKAMGGCTSQVTDDDIRTLASFYANQYLGPIQQGEFAGPCSYRWKSGAVPTATNPMRNSSQSDPNSPALKNGPNDPFLTSLLTCANSRNITSANITALQQACGQACQTSS